MVPAFQTKSKHQQKLHQRRNNLQQKSIYRKKRCSLKQHQFDHKFLIPTAIQQKAVFVVLCRFLTASKKNL